MPNTNNTRMYWFKSDDTILTNILREFEKTEKINVLELYNNYKQLNNNNNSKVVVKKKKRDIYREKNTNSMLKKLEEKEKIKFNTVLDDDKLMKLGLDNMSKFTTVKYKILYKFELLKKLVKTKGDFTEILDLYLQLYALADNEANKKLIKKITKKFNEIAYKFYTLKNLSDRLPPLDFYNNSQPKLDDWQIETINYINNNESVIVQAPTSSGKTWVSIYSVVRNKKIDNDKITLYIVPSKPLALQVAGLFRKILGGAVSFLYEDRTYYSSDTKVIVATVNEAETHIYKFYDRIDFVIIDEVHNLNEPEIGNSLENLIKLFSHCNFLALSATIGNSEFLINWWRQFNKNKINTITYKKRFINLQRCQFNFSKSTIENLHPMDCLNLDDLINDKFNIPFTPYDMAILYEKIENSFEYDDIEHLDPDEVIKNDRPSLDDTKEYETLLKTGLYNLSNKFPNKVSKLIKSFDKTPSLSEKDIDLSSFTQQLKEKDLLPAILFNYSSETCNMMYSDLISGIIEKENLLYPYHYDNLQYKNELIEDYKKSLQRFELSEKQSQANCKKRIDKINIVTEKEEKLRNFDNLQLGIYINKLTTKYNQQYKHIEQNNNKSLRDIQLRNLTKEHKKSIKIGKVPMYVDIYKKHKAFCFTNDNPMSEDEIRDIRRELRKTLSTEKDKISISYENIFIQGLKYGIGIYTNNINEIYKLIVQRLCQNNKLNIIIADKELSQGVNLPFRLSAMVGYNGHRDFDQVFVQQASGRSGRRGKDRKGYQCFVNVNWDLIMKGTLPNISGLKEDESINVYPILEKLNPNINYKQVYNNKLYKNSISESNCIDIDNTITREINSSHDKFMTLIWKLRKFGWKCLKKYTEFLEYSVIYYKDKKITVDLEIEFIDKINEILIKSSDLINDYKKNTEFTKDMKVLGDILKFTHNQLEYEIQFTNIRNIMNIIFNKILRIQYISSNLR